MSTEDGVLRLENALATLSELSADHERRLARVEESRVVLIELVRSHNEGMDEFRAMMAGLAHNHNELARNHNEGMAELRAAQAESNYKIAALADAHIRTETALASLTEKVNALNDNRQG